MPMTKSGVKAMDATTEFLTSDLAPQEIQDANFNPTQFIVSGASKVSVSPADSPLTSSYQRGWTAWLVAAVDPRVMVLVPVVLDLLNIPDVETFKVKYICLNFFELRTTRMRGV